VALTLTPSDPNDPPLLLGRPRTQSGCEAGCEAAEQPTRARAAPSYVQPKAPKANRPAMCFTAKPEHTAFLQCVGKESDVQRLCPCELRDPKWDV